MLNSHAILFDLDGTLINSIPAIEATWKNWAHKHNIDKNHLLKNIHGTAAKSIIETYAPHLNTDKEFQQLLKEEINQVHKMKIIPGAKELLSSLHPSTWGIVTMSPKVLAYAKLEELSLPIPKILVTAEDTKQSKPHPAPFLKGAEKLNLSPQNIIAFEDSVSGIQSASSALMKTFQITYSGHTPIQNHIEGAFKDWYEVLDSRVLNHLFLNTYSLS